MTEPPHPHNVRARAASDNIHMDNLLRGYRCELGVQLEALLKLGSANEKK